MNGQQTAQHLTNKCTEANVRLEDVCNYLTISRVTLFKWREGRTSARHGDVMAMRYVADTIDRMMSDNKLPAKPDAGKFERMTASTNRLLEVLIDADDESA